ncbi:MAG: hypothetical protein D6731_21235 [Planctomycetota bacterium]|nr:MAG: hypothetical protein D6731_21235 [Planctomycetota bacterium]
MSADLFFGEAGHRWRVVSGYEAYVRKVLAAGARAPEELPGARVVKHNRVRTVVRVPEGPSGALFVKRFRAHGLAKQLVHTLRGSPAAREFRAMRALAASGVPCPEPVVLGEERRAGRVVGSVLATREVSGCEELAERTQRARRDREATVRRRLAEALARAAWSLFAAGVEHPDMHPGNFLIDPSGALVVLDLHSAAVRGGALGARRRRRLLGKLAWGLGPPFGDRYRDFYEELGWFCAEYARLDPALGGADDLRAGLLADALALEAVRLRSREKRCLVESSTFAVTRSPRGRLYRRREAPAAEVRAALDGADERAVVAGIVVERVHAAAGLRRDPLLRAWKLARACEVRGVATRCAFALERRGGFCGGESVLLLAAADGPSLPEALRAAGPARRRELLREAGALVGRLHAGGLGHADLRGDALRVSSGGVYLAALEGVRHEAAPAVDALRWFAALPLSGHERLRFWRAYARAGGWRPWAAPGEDERAVRARLLHDLLEEGPTAGPRP